MLSKKTPSFGLAIFVLLTLGAVTLKPATAPADPFYKGKTLTFLTNQNPGGSTDTFMRLVQRHVARFIPGNPKIAFKYLPGGGGNIAPNFISHRSKPDGFTLGFITGSVTSQAVNAPGVDFDLTKMRWVAAVAEPSVYLVRKDIAKQAKDLFNPPKTIVMGGMGGTSSLDVGLMLSFDILRVPPDKFKRVKGYRGTPAAIPALRSGEMHYWAISLTGYHGTGYRAMVDEGVLAPPLFQGGLLRSDGTIGRDQRAADMPTLGEVYREIHGKSPSGLAWEGWQWLIGTRQLLRGIMFPHGTADEPVRILNKAFKDLAKDEKFQAQSKKIVKVKINFVPGEEAQALLGKLVNLKPHVREYISKLMGVKF